jgi:hypothetical protein
MVANALNYDADGDALNFNASAPPTIFLYPDGPLDPVSGLRMCGDGTRDEDITDGAFIETDERGYGKISDPLTLNALLYGDSDPENNDDPSGHYAYGGIYGVIATAEAQSSYTADLAMAIGDNCSNAVIEGLTAIAGSIGAGGALGHLTGSLAGGPAIRIVQKSGAVTQLDPTENALVKALTNAAQTHNLITELDITYHGDNECMTLNDSEELDIDGTTIRDQNGKDLTSAFENGVTAGGAIWLQGCNTGDVLYPSNIAQQMSGILHNVTVWGSLVCSPKMVPGDMRVSTGPLWAKETFDEGQKAYAGADHRQAA